jgi:hypothetical protein
MSKQVRFRRGTTAQHASFTGIAGEVTVDTDKKVPVVHNGTTAGGIPLLREDRPRGFTRMEVFTTTGTTYTIANKTDLKRIRVTVYGGGGGGGAQSGGGAGGYGFRVLDVSELTTNTTVTIGAGGGGGATGGTTSFGTYISASGGGAGAGNDAGGAPGAASGTGVVNLGAQAGRNGHTYTHPVYGGSYFPQNGASGGGFGAGRAGVAAQGIRGGGGGSSSQAGAQGCVIIEEIYGFV